jgi:D-alanyl-D-alanine carboxypeptidase
MTTTVYTKDLICGFALLLLTAPAYGEGAVIPQPGVVVDAETGQLLYAHEATRSWYPASLTKMMTLYLAFEALSASKLKLDEYLAVSPHAASQPATSLGLAAGSKIRVDELLAATAAISANDAAVVLAERLGVTEQRFAVLMTNRARQMGMEATRFINATGLPGEHQQTSARDMAILGLRLRQDFPQHFALFSSFSIKYRGRSLASTNQRFLGYDGADGIKTGFTCDAGYNLVASVHYGDRQLIGVVLGARDAADRYQRMIKLLDLEPGAAGQGPHGVKVTALPGSPDGQPVDMGSTVCSGDIVAGQKLPGWGILLGVFSTKKEAQRRAVAAKSHLKGVVSNGRLALLPRRFRHGSSWKALLVGMSKREAGRACRRLWSRKILCTTRSPQVMNRRGFAQR